MKRTDAQGNEDGTFGSSYADVSVNGAMRVGDALTWATVIAFLLYLLSAVALNIVPVTKGPAPPPPPPPAASAPAL